MLGCMLTDSVNEHIEHEWIKRGPLHRLLQMSGNMTSVPRKEALIVYVHVLRTSGETLKLTVFNDVAYQFGPEWVDPLHCWKDCEHRL